MIYGIIAAGIVFGLIIGCVLLWLKKKHMVNLAERMAGDILDEAQDAAQELEADVKDRVNDFKENLLDKFEQEMEPKQERIEKLKRQNIDKEEQLKFEWQKNNDRLKSKKKKFSTTQNVYDKKLNSYQSKVNKNRAVLLDYINKLSQQYKIDIEDLKENIKTVLQQEEKSQVTKNMQLQEEIFGVEVEKRAKRILGSVLHRFQRPYCPERGIQNINFSTKENMFRTLGKNFEHVPAIEQLIGVDLTPVEEKLFLNVSGFDPVRRELTRITLEKLMREKNVNQASIERLVSKSKKQLFKKIRTDGNRLAKELDLKGLHPEIRNMMGALRYRYSFSQNQHFHCAEVGWLCGLLSSEIQLDVRRGRRAGMLHDLGKAMDHSIDGGHAVIGADFIDKHGEKEDVVHAVRAHHYDETPSSDLAYLVIAADAISGARPGARRSTAESYMHKMHELERIGSSMPGVLQTFILSAGREVRVMVDANKIDDQQSMELSQELAKKIEEDMVYPGTIRVTVVRETLAVEYAK